MTIKEPQANALANLLHELRPDWAIKPLLGMLWQHRDKHPFPELTAAAVTAANTPTNRTPAIIFLDGPHWHAARPAPQQFLSAAEKSRLQGAQMMGYYAAKEGRDISSPSDPMFRDLITPGDLNPAATMDAYQRGQKIAQWELSQEPAQLALEEPTP